MATLVMDTLEEFVMETSRKEQLLVLVTMIVSITAVKDSLYLFNTALLVQELFRFTCLSFYLSS